MGMCTGFGADPKCTDCGRTMSHVMEAHIEVCEERTEYMNLMNKISKERELKKKKEQLDTEIGKSKTWASHVWGLENNSEKIKIVKCTKCHESRLYLQLMDKTSCTKDKPLEIVVVKGVKDHTTEFRKKLYKSQGEKK